MKTISLVLLLSSCVPPQQQPSYFQGQPAAPQPGYVQPQPGYVQPQPQAQGYAAQASCTDTLQCYGACNPMTEHCIGACDQRTSPDAAQNAHAVLQCMAQSGCSDQNCVTQRCAAPLQTCAGTQLAQQPPAPQQGNDDLVYQVPAGWNESRTYLNAITLGFDKEDFYDHQHPRIHVFPSRPRQGAINDQYNALWNELVVAPGEFSQLKPPGPLRRRTATGYAMALDAQGTNLANGKGFVTVGLYVLYTDDKLVPIFATNLDWQFQKEAQAFFDTLTIRGAAPSKTPLFTMPELAGKWSTQSASLANYVSSSGNYVGDASIATAEELTLDANGTFKSHFVGVGRGRVVNDDDHGRWTVDDDMLVFNDKRTTKRRIWGSGTAPQGNPHSICMAQGNAQPRYDTPEDAINATWYGAKQ